MKSYKELTVWQKAMDLCGEIYKTTETFPKSEIYGLTSQIRRCAVSIPSNIAERQYREHTAEYIQFLRIAYGSGAELETQLEITLRINYLKDEDYKRLTLLLEEIMKMLNKLINTLRLKLAGSPNP